MAERKNINVVSACFEAMLDQKFHIYAGGLGVVQAGLLKSAGRKDWPINMYGLGILWKQGYYDQKIGQNRMEVHYTSRHYDFLEDIGIKVLVEIKGKPNYIKVWYLKPEIFKTAPFFLLDTDIKENDHLARQSTQRLYGGNEETRLAQEIILGIGGVRTFEALGIPIDIYHGQEGHSMLAGIEILRKHLASGLSFADALQAAKKQFVFTTHTPELAGNENHDVDLMIRMGCFPGIPKEDILKIGGYPPNHNIFNMTVGGFRLAKISNAVSKLHLETTCQMWHGIDGLCSIISVTNGVDSDWQFPELAQADSPEAMEMASKKYKEKLLKYIEKRTGKKFKENVLTMVWARRFIDYKRPWLIFMDWPWLKKLLNDGIMQLVIAGKPHPNDLQAIHYFNWLCEKSLEVPNLAVLAGYERDQSKLLKAGADVWLQTARRPREACGTSWMATSALVVSSRDGGILESNPENYFSFGVDYPRREGEQDTFDFKNLQRITEKEIIETYYNDKPQWYEKALAAKREKNQEFSSDRMLEDYIHKIYLNNALG